MFELHDSIMSAIFNLSQCLGGPVYAYNLMVCFTMCDSLVTYYKIESENINKAVDDVFTILNNVRVDDNFFTFEEVREKIVENKPNNF